MNPKVALILLAFLALHTAATAADSAIVGTWVFAEIVDPIKAEGGGLLMESGRLEETSLRFGVGRYDFLRKDVVVLHMDYRVINTDERATVIEPIPDYTPLDHPALAGNPAAQAAMKRTIDSMRQQITINTLPGSIEFRDLVGRKLRYVLKPKTVTDPSQSQ